MSLHAKKCSAAAKHQPVSLSFARKRVKRIFYIILIPIMFWGCFTTGPVNNTDFRSVNNLFELEGVYQNRGEGDLEASTIYLSSIIWPGKQTFDHGSIEAIDVRVLNDNTLRVQALSKTGIIKESQYVKGRDFTFDSGRIRIRRDAVLSLAYPPGNPLIGPTYGEEEIGIDQKGHGKYRTKMAFAGTAFVIVPLAGGTRDDYRFNKIGN